MHVAPTVATQQSGEESTPTNSNRMLILPSLFSIYLFYLFFISFDLPLKQWYGRGMS